MIAGNYVLSILYNPDLLLGLLCKVPTFGTFLIFASEAAYIVAA